MYVAKVNYWPESKKLGEPAWKQITEWISESDATLVIITDSTVKRGLSVGSKSNIQFIRKNSKKNKDAWYFHGFENVELEKVEKNVGFERIS